MTVKGKRAILNQTLPDLCPKVSISSALQKGYGRLTFHRVIRDFMIQGGDPKAIAPAARSMWGGGFDGGVTPNLSHFSGAVAYANSGSTTTDSEPVLHRYRSEMHRGWYQKPCCSRSSFLRRPKLYSTIGGALARAAAVMFGQVFRRSWHSLRHPER